MSLLSAPLWEKIGRHPHHGIALPLFSLHSKESAGIGEFLDLIPMIDWCAEVGLDVIQLLPLNDTYHDPSPYYGISSCALHPIYLSLHALPFLERHEELKKIVDEMKILTRTPRIALAEILNRKLYFLKRYIDVTRREFLEAQVFKEFVAENPWLESYALFRALKEQFQQIAWWHWPQEARRPTKELLQKHADDVALYQIVQYLCFSQLKQAKDYAHRKKVFIHGDIPILLSPDSADIWAHPELFDMTLSAGAPPDPLGPEGQYWGFPVLRWEAHKKQNYAWWEERLRCASHFYDIYRIDHVLGLFRIWAIPLGKKPTEGKYIPENPELWIPHGKELLTMMVQDNPMLPIAEDLGTVPPGVRETLSALGICGTKVMRWERNWQGDRAYIPYAFYPQFSLTTVSTHDVEPLTLWWKKYPEEAKAFAAFKGWDYTPALSHAHLKEILRDSHHTPSYFHINLLQEYLALFPELVAAHPEDERINIPGTILPGNWSYRFRPTIEELTSHEKLKKAMREIIS